MPLHLVAGTSCDVTRFDVGAAHELSFMLKRAALAPIVDDRGNETLPSLRRNV
jgi:hypothetical protein